jgi:purine-binding chemotaxis protein CheW
MFLISKIPEAPDYIEGMINLRGKVIPLINLRRRFGLERREINKQTRIIVVDIEGRILGIVVDSVSEVLRIPASTVEPPPPVVSGKGAQYIKGVGKIGDKLLILLELEKLFRDIEKEVSDVLNSDTKASN